MSRASALGPLALLPLLVSPFVARAQEAPEVRDAIKKGLDYLRKEQFNDGTWDFRNHTIGITALAGLTLAENRVPLSDPAVRKAYYYIRENCQDEEQTYDVALSIMFLHRVGDRRDRGLMRSLARRLTEGQLDSGGWTYRLREGGTGPGDNSNTQFAVLGLWVASRTGADVEEPLDRVEARFRSSQVDSGGWGYRPDQASETPSMSFAGLFALAVAEADDIRRQQQAEIPSADQSDANSEGSPGAKPAGPKRGPGQSLLADAAFRKGFERVGVILGRPVNAQRPSPTHLPYYLWSVERLGVLLGVAEFGETDWYDKGAEALLECQRENGSWHWEERAIGGPVANTCFALLFLRRANLGSDITRLLEGDPDKPFVIGDRSDTAPLRFKTLKEAVAEARDGEIIDVEGPGPYEPEHQLFDKSLTLRAAKGYEPIFRYTRGRDSLGLRRDPNRDPEARHMFNVQGASLHLEGLRLRMDPPLPAEHPSGIVGLADASLTAVNCVLSQSNGRGAAGVVAHGTSEVSLQNCLCAGLEATIHFTAAAQHRIAVENCLIVGGIAVAVQSAEEVEDHAVTIVLRANTVHADELLQIQRMSGAVTVQADGNAMRLGWVCSSLGTGPRTWRGGDPESGAPNWYDVRRWIGRRGRALHQVHDMETWRRFWKTEEAGSIQQPVPFAIARQLGGYRHDLSPLDWRIVGDHLAEGAADFGSDPYVVGVGPAYRAYKDQSASDPPAGEAP